MKKSAKRDKIYAAKLIILVIILGVIFSSLSYYPGDEEIASKYTVCTAMVRYDTQLYDTMSKDKNNLLELKKNDMLLILRPIGKKSEKWSKVLYKNRISYVETKTLINKKEEEFAGSLRPIIVDNIEEYAYAKKNIAVFDYDEIKSTTKMVGRIPKGCNFAVVGKGKKSIKIYVHRGSSISNKNVEFVAKSILGKNIK